MVAMSLVRPFTSRWDASATLLVFRMLLEISATSRVASQDSATNLGARTQASDDKDRTQTRKVLVSASARRRTRLVWSLLYSVATSVVIFGHASDHTCRVSAAQVLERALCKRVPCGRALWLV